MDGWLTTDPTSLAQTFNQRQRLFFAVALSNSAHVLVSDAPVCSALPSFMSSLRSHTVRCPRLMAHDSLRPSTPRAPGTKGFPIVVDNIARTTFHAPRFLHDIYFHAAHMRGRRGRPGSVARLHEAPLGPERLRSGGRDCYYRDSSSGRPRPRRWAWYRPRPPPRSLQSRGRGHI